ncbi:hypothetical protein SRO_4409 [Streptomyces rochei]|nr:hypothetical protein SRO_4409 [Streptomyces rochei]
MLCAMRRWVGVSRWPSKSACNRLAGLSVTLITYSPSLVLTAPGEYSAGAAPNTDRYSVKVSLYTVIQRGPGPPRPCAKRTPTSGRRGPPPGALDGEAVRAGSEYDGQDGGQ